MALIGTLRNKMTKWVVGLVAVAMAAFILGSDFLGNGPKSFFGADNSVGEIAGNSISMEEYQAAIQETENNYALNLNRRPTELEMPTIRQQAWDLLIARRAVTPEYEKVGVKVHSDEEWDMIQGKNVDEGIKNAFRDSLGRFDRTRLMQQLQMFNSFPAGSPQRAQWDIYRASLAPARARLKYEALLLKSNYVTKAEAERAYHESSDVAEAKYLYVPFYALSDSLVKVTDADLSAYYEKHKEKYKSTETKSLSYVIFPVEASATDSAAILKSLNELKEAFINTKVDSLFAVTNNTSTSGTPFANYNASTLPEGLQSRIESLKPGVVEGPFLENGFYKMVKLVRTGTDTAYFARASHILFRSEDASDAGKKAALTNAKKVLDELKAGANFSAMARQYGTDGTASNGGDLGWFGKGSMVKPFEKAVFGATKTGLLNEVVETDFGYHLINITGVKNNKTYSVAMIEEEITPSDETQNEIFRNADNFSNDLDGVEAFLDRAKKDNLNVFQANDLSPADRRINNLGDARQIITWAYRDGKIGKVSEATEVNGDYVIAVVTNETKEGYKPLDKELKETITPLAKKQLIGKLIADKLKGKNDPLETLAKDFGTDAIVNSTSDLKLSENSMVSVGLDPSAVGKTFSVENGKRSKPFICENGVLVIDMIRKTTAPDIADYSTYSAQLLQTLNNRSSAAISEALKSSANVKDRRYKLF
jgi:peptidyl-prolyl cis-trans isomerase D